MRALLLSNSTMPGEKYLSYPLPYIKDFLGEYSPTALFIPFAAVTFSFNEYESKVKQQFQELGCELKSIHHEQNYKQAVREAEMIVVGGGNTWQLLRMMQDHDLINEVATKVLVQSTPYIGWSAGSNMACPTIKTTNDMPIIMPLDFNALNLVPFQINPHFLDKKLEGHGGESREDRINEFLEVNPETYVVGLREGSILRVEGNSIKLLGDRACRIFKYQHPPHEYKNDDDINFILSR